MKNNLHPALDNIETLDGTVQQNRFHRFENILNLNLVAGSSAAVKLRIKDNEKWIPKKHLRILNNGGIYELWYSKWIYDQEQEFFNPPSDVIIEWHFAK